MAVCWQCDCSCIPDKLYYRSNTSKQEMAKVTKVVCKDCKEYIRRRGYYYTVTDALCLAAAHGHSQCVKRAMTTTGADVNTLNKALTYSVVKGAAKGIHMLVDAGSDVNKVNDKNGETILMIASRLGYDKAVGVLIRKGADVNSVDKEGNTALILSARQDPHVIVCECTQSRELGLINHFRCVALLLRAGTHINKYNKYNLNGICENLYWYDGGIHHQMAPHKPEAEVYTLLYAAGEMLPDGATSEGKMLINTVDRAKRLYHVLFENLRFDLKHLCRDAIRKHLLKLDAHTHLFGRVPRQGTGLPKPLVEYLLFRMSLSEVGPFGLPNDRTEIGPDKIDCERMPYRFHVFGAACTESLDPLH